MRFIGRLSDFVSPFSPRAIRKFMCQLSGFTLDFVPISLYGHIHAEVEAPQDELKESSHLITSLGSKWVPDLRPLKGTIGFRITCRISLGVHVFICF